MHLRRLQNSEVSSAGAVLMGRINALMALGLWQCTQTAGCSTADVMAAGILLSTYTPQHILCQWLPGLCGCCGGETTSALLGHDCVAPVATCKCNCTTTVWYVAVCAGHPYNGLAAFWRSDNSACRMSCGPAGSWTDS